ncbi:MAG: DUF4965 domain-containing protein [Armatimonadota bacterium]|nr:DUF4965 domain-containing protein [Armatimonadota bacterium]MCX7777486.1 DUF4965 domain-containing protein [Armatimonadota bacterium]MDW8025505.1 DUF4965 domain-containing protein [Armatimonadota bacterium]
MHLMATPVSKLGSRFTLIFDPWAHQVLHSSLGRWLDFPTDLAIGIESNGICKALPFTKRFEHFEVVEQRLRMCGVTFIARSLQLGLGLNAEIISPFYPQDEWTSLAPVFFFRLTIFPVERLFWSSAERAQKHGRVFLLLRRDGLHIKPSFDRLKISYEVPMTIWRGERYRPKNGDVGRDVWRCEERILPLSPGAKLLEDGVEFEFDLSDASRSQFELLWCTYVDEPVLSIFGDPASFKYIWLFSDVDSVAHFASANRNEMLHKTALFERLFDEAFLSKSQADLVKFAFQNFLLNTWWVVREDGSDWFSVWEGSCHYHSTVDVEYNCALVYLSLWHELLEMLLNEWSCFEMHDEVGNYIAHDMGYGLEVSKQAYPHPMQVEENSNFILMLFCLWHWTANDELIERHRELCKRLTEYFERSDTTGNGFPNLGVANTIDDASPAVQYAREQTYLAVKTLCACHAASIMAEKLGDDEWASQCRSIVDRIKRTLDERAWLGDHYAVCLERTAEGLVDVWTGEELHGELRGWDAYSIYTANGLLYPLLCGEVPPVNLERVRADLVNSYLMALNEYGCTHTSADLSNVWVSQNLWRDFVASYLGVDLPDNSSRYFALQELMNTGMLTKGFIDTYFTNNLCFYPRGITSIGYLLSLCGLQIDRRKGLVKLKRCAPYPCRIPLLPLAIWREGIIPFVVYELKDGEIVGRIIGEQALVDLRVEWT